MKTLPVLTSERVLLRPFDASDAASVERLAGEKVIADTTLNIPHPYPAGEAASWIATHEQIAQQGNGVAYAITEKSAPAELRGAVAISIDRQHARGELGYWIGAPYWGRGLATEAVRLLLAHGFDALKLHRIQAHHLTRNPASGRVMQKAGMRFEGIHRGAICKNGIFEDVAVYALLANDRANEQHA